MRDVVDLDDELERFDRTTAPGRSSSEAEARVTDLVLDLSIKYPVMCLLIDGKSRDRPIERPLPMKTVEGFTDTGRAPGSKTSLESSTSKALSRSLFLHTCLPGRERVS